MHGADFAKQARDHINKVSDEYNFSPEPRSAATLLTLRSCSHIQR
jgi:hypothetical protein